MISVTSSASEYLQGLITDQGDDSLGLRLRALNPGMPSADIELTFCAEDDREADDVLVEQDGLLISIDATSKPWLRNASVDFISNPTGGQLTISAPGLKGQTPAADAPLEERVQWLLNTEVNPQVAMHGGQVSLVEVTADKLAVLKFGGGCQGCGMVSVTLQEGIEKTFHEKLPELSGVVDVTEHEKGENPYYA